MKMIVQLLASVDRLAQPLRRFFDRLTDEQKLLLVLKRDLYDGRWEPMLTDLTNRLEGRPYVIKFGRRIEDDIARIGQMRQLEEHYEVDLAAYLEPIPSDVAEATVNQEAGV